MALSIIIPVLNDAPALACLLEDLALARAASDAPEILVVDGGSRDDVVAVCRRAGVGCLRSATGRGEQLAAGIEASRGDILWLLHADTRLQGDHWRAVASQSSGWGRCRLRFEPHLHGMAMVAFCMHWRSRFTGICTGDQGIWMTRACLDAAGGMPRQPLMEDIELSRRLKRQGRPRVLSIEIRTAPRRWQSGGLWRTILFMWSLRLRYWLGTSAEDLARRYVRPAARPLLANLENPATPANPANPANPLNPLNPNKGSMSPVRGNPGR
jgi:rSAM/selenodomain-associated transferase 2